ncbi:MAG: ATP-dependent sacrificial sulfur transferase LarE [Actinobacteria bacterium]|nr:ATP-dependent sacrificial sulfur transferase LarE [Actinomycetota bacterium]
MRSAAGAPHSDRSREVRGTLERLEAELASLGSACVAFSGGVDSSLVLAAAARVLGPARVVAFTAVSATYLPEELQTARDLAAELGVRHVVVETHEFDEPAFTGNPRERCYFCKRELVAEMVRVAAKTECSALLDGANLDDLGDHRPGMRATAEGGVVHPLLDAGIGKVEVRRLSKELGLATWDAPQQACLASRIPFGEPITVEKLQAIGAAERVLHELGFRQCRVRHHGSVARIEVEGGDLGRALAARETIARRLRALGFTYVTLDLEGFRSGSMNEAPEDEAPKEQAPGQGAACGGPASADAGA